MGTSVAVALLLLMCLTAVQGWTFPTACVDKWNGTRVECCPLFNGSRCGSANNRGSCMMIPMSRGASPRDVGSDERGGLPGSFFSAICQCKTGFMGPACGECTFGLKGDKCDQPNKVVRRSLFSYTLLEFTRFLADMHYCKFKLDLEFSILTTIDRFRRAYYVFKTVSYIDLMCFIHTYITEGYIVNGREIDWINYGHESTGFFGWHRLFLLYFERQIQKCLNNPSWGLPYYPWEYEKPDECSMCRPQYLGATDIQGRITPDSVLYHWRMVCGGLSYPGSVCPMTDCECERDKIIRQVGLGTILKSTYENCTACFKFPLDTRPYTAESLNSFRNCIEGFRDQFNRSAVMCHNAFHMFFGGTMSRVPVSCNDIMFWVHHANIDRFFETYINLNNITPASYPADNNIFGHGANSCIGCFFQCWRMRSMFATLGTWNIVYI